MLGPADDVDDDDEDVMLYVATNQVSRFKCKYSVTLKLQVSAETAATM